MVESQIAENKYLRYFSYLVMLELFLMGSGQEIHVTGFLTLRMVNFIIAVGISIYLFVRTNDFPKTILWILGVFTTMLVFSIFEAYLRDTKMEFVVEDIKPLFYFYILLFYYYVSSSRQVVDQAYRLLMLSAKVMTALYLIYILLTDVLQVIPYVVAYQTLSSDSFLFRGVGSAFFYKGFVFLPIAAVGFMRERKYIWLLLVTIAIYFTFTRGLYFLLVFGLLAYYMKTHYIDIVKIIAFALVALLIYLVVEVTGILNFDESFLNNREESDYTRLLIVEQVLDAVTYWSLLIGHGFGYGIAERTSHMEISYLDIFHKQGILGVAFWVTLLVAVLRYGQQVEGKYKNVSDFWVIAALMMYLQSFFNPYINTPMGMTLIFMSLVFCYRFSQDEHFADSRPLPGRLP